jgi:hypothetical protein
MTTFAKSQTPFGRPAFSWTLCSILNPDVMYSYSICYPEKEEIEFPDKRLTGEEVLEFVSSYPWVDELKKLESIPFEEVNYNPSLDFKNLDDNYSFCLTAEGKPGAEKFAVWFNRKITYRPLFGLLGEKTKFEVIDRQFEVKESIELLKHFLRQDYDIIEKAIKS